MSKIIDKYLELKNDDPSKLYLFKSGKFYIFVGDDCDYINNYIVLKKVKFSGEYYKCGFPNIVLEDYLRVFKNHNLNIEVIEDYTLNNINVKSLEDIIRSIDINNITPIEAINKLNELKGLVNERR